MKAWGAGGGGLFYVYRPVLLGGCSAGDACVDLGTGEPLQLPGFGVELAIKNMEYSAMDDTKVSVHAAHPAWRICVRRPIPFRACLPLENPVSIPQAAQALWHSAVCLSMAIDRACRKGAQCKGGIRRSTHCSLAEWGHAAG